MDMRKTLIEYILESLLRRLKSKETWLLFFVLSIGPAVITSIDEREGWLPIIIAGILGLCCIFLYAFYLGIRLWRYDRLDDVQKHLSRNSPDDFL